MAKPVRIKHNSKAYAALLKDPKIAADLLERAERIAAAAGGESRGFHAAQSTPRKRARAAVVAALGDSKNKMIHNLDAGR